MANVIELRVTGQDLSPAALQQAVANVRAVNAASMDSVAASRAFAASKAATTAATLRFSDALKGTRGSLMILGSTVFPQATSAAVLFGEGTQSLVSVGKSLIPVLGAAGLTGVVLALSAAVATGITGWQAYKARVEEAATAARAANSDHQTLMSQVAALRDVQHMMTPETRSLVAQGISADSPAARRAATSMIQAYQPGLAMGQFATDARMQMVGAGERAMLQGQADQAAREKQLAAFAQATSGNTDLQPWYDAAKKASDDLAQFQFAKAQEAMAKEAAARETYLAGLDELALAAEQKQAEAMGRHFEAVALANQLELQQEGEKNAVLRDELLARLNAKEITEEEFRARTEQLEEAHQARVVAIHRKATKDRVSLAQGYMQVSADIFGSLSQLLAMTGEKNFELAKAFAYAQAIINTAQGVTKALAEYGWPYGVIYGAAIAAAGAVQIATIASSEPSYAVGSEFIPQTGPATVHRGERIVQSDINRDLTDFLDSGGRQMVVVVELDGATLAKGIGRMSRDGRLSIAARSVT